MTLRVANKRATASVGKAQRSLLRLFMFSAALKFVQSQRKEVSKSTKNST